MHEVHFAVFGKELDQGTRLTIHYSHIVSVLGCLTMVSGGYPVYRWDNQMEWHVGQQECYNSIFNHKKNDSLPLRIKPNSPKNISHDWDPYAVIQFIKKQQITTNL